MEELVGNLSHSYFQSLLGPQSSQWSNFIKVSHFWVQTAANDVFDILAAIEKLSFRVCYLLIMKSQLRNEEHTLDLQKEIFPPSLSDM